MRLALERRRAEQASRVRVQCAEIFLSGVVLFILTLNIAAFAKAETDCGGIKVWLKVSLGIYLADIVVALNQLMQVKKLHHENLWLLLVMLIIVLINTTWFIYGNAIFWRNREECGAEDEAPRLTYCMNFMMIIGYCTMCKCCCVSTLVVLLLPFLIRMYRQANHGNWQAAAPSLLKKLKKG